MLNPILTKAYLTTAAVAAYVAVKFSGDGTVATAAAATDSIVGVSSGLAAASGERCDVIRSGIAEIKYGGTVARGDLLTVDASGYAITATAAAGSNVRILGIAEVSGVSGDIGAVLLSPGSFQG